MSLHASQVTPGVPGGAQSGPGLGDRQAQETFLVPSHMDAPPSPQLPFVLPGHAPQFSTHHADLSCHEVAQSVEPLHINLEVLGLVTETGLGKMQRPHSVFLSIIFEHEVSS